MYQGNNEARLKQYFVEYGQHARVRFRGGCLRITGTLLTDNWSSRVLLCVVKVHKPIMETVLVHSQMYCVYVSNILISCDSMCFTQN